MEEMDHVLLERARMLASPAGYQHGTTLDNTILVTKFLLSPEVYGLEAFWIREVLPLKSLTPIPGTPAFVMGVVNVRGQIISVINLKRFFNLKEKGITELNKIMIVRNENIEFGILVDSILGMQEVPGAEIQPGPVTLNGTGAEYVKGVSRDGLIILDGERILHSKAIVINEKK
jgi:purine-binding chemotaxis protein CheW